MYLYAAAQAPSPDTMHGPRGSSGVHTRSNIGHSAGWMRPVMTSPQRQGVVSTAGCNVISKRLSASKSANSSHSARPLRSISPRPRHTSLLGVNTRSMASCASAFPPPETARP